MRAGPRLRPGAEQLRLRDEDRRARACRLRCEIAIFVAGLLLATILHGLWVYAARTETVDGRRIVIIDGDTIDVHGERRTENAS